MHKRYLPYDAMHVICSECSTRTSAVMLARDEIAAHDSWHDRQTED